MDIALISPIQNRIKPLFGFLFFVFFCSSSRFLLQKKKKKAAIITCIYRHSIIKQTARSDAVLAYDGVFVLCGVQHGDTVNIPKYQLGGWCLSRCGCRLRD